MIRVNYCTTVCIRISMAYRQRWSVGKRVVVCWCGVFIKVLFVIHQSPNGDWTFWHKKSDGAMVGQSFTLGIATTEILVIQRRFNRITSQLACRPQGVRPPWVLYLQENSTLEKGIRYKLGHIIKGQQEHPGHRILGPEMLQRGHRVAFWLERRHAQVGVL